MTPKFLLLTLALVALVSRGLAICHRTRGDKKTFAQIIKKTSCRRPRDTLVELEVEDGYDKLSPGVVEVPRCTGQYCTHFGEKCLPKPGTNYTMMFKATARMMRNQHATKCIRVPVEVHTECECSCNHSQNDCPYNKVFNEFKCECVCDSAERKKCELRMMNGDPVMWDPNSCTCPCNIRTECETNKMWVPDLCRCSKVRYGA